MYIAAQKSVSELTCGSDDLIVNSVLHRMLSYRSLAAIAVNYYFAREK